MVWGPGGLDSWHSPYERDCYWKGVPLNPKPPGRKKPCEPLAKQLPPTQQKQQKRHRPGDSIRDLFIPYLEVTISTILKGSRKFTIPKKITNSQNCHKKSTFAPGRLCASSWLRFHLHRHRYNLLGFLLGTPGTPENWTWFTWKSLRKKKNIIIPMGIAYLQKWFSHWWLNYPSRPIRCVILPWFTRFTLP